MSGASAFFILIPVMYALFCGALTLMAVVDKRLVAARWAALGFFVAFVSILVDGFREPGGDHWVSWFTVVTHFVPLLIMVQAFLVRHARNAPRWAMALVGAASVFVMPEMPWAPPNWLRGVSVQAVCATIIASGLPMLWRERRNSPVDRIAFFVLLGAMLSYAARTAIIYVKPIGTTREDVMAFYEGLNIVFHSASALMGMCVGIVLMVTIGHDMLRGRMEEGEIDPLTALGNRRRLERHILENETGRADVGAVLAIDLDHFKRINDRYGHDAGDKVLRSVGRTLNSVFGEMGCVCRTGGEEFVVLLDRDHCEGVAALALAARMALSAIAFDGPLADVRVTASIGFHFPAAGETLREAMARADQGVYCAKTDGRDRVVEVVENKGLHIFKAVA